MENTTNVIKTIENEGGTAIIVAQIANGFSVSIKDIEADEVFPTILIFKTEAEALAKAQSIAEKC